MLSNSIFALFAGFANGMAFFLVAVGLTWIFGILKIMNLAHATVMVVGGYVTYQIVGSYPPSLAAWLGASLVAALVCAVLGIIVDQVVFRRLRKVDYHYVLIATFALLLFLEGLIKVIWGSGFVSVVPPPELSGPMNVLGYFVPKYTIFVIAAGVFTFIAIELLVQRTWIGKVLQAIASDAWMTRLLSVNVPVYLLLSVALSFAVAGLAGGLLLPNQALSPILGASYLIYAFFAVIIGGLGSIRGAFLASIILGLVDALNTVLLPAVPGFAIYVVLGAFLLLRPQGLIPSMVTK